jgi:lipoyl-dependent peroxiredoxin
LVLTEILCRNPASRSHVHRTGGAAGSQPIIAEVGLSRNDAGVFGLSAALAVTVVGVYQRTAESLVRSAVAICAYFNAIRGSVDVAISVSVR